jgi:OmpA-OmpF porin, OOP family
MNHNTLQTRRPQAWTFATLAAAVTAMLASVACTSTVAPSASSAAPAAAATHVSPVSPVATGKADERIGLNQQAYAQQQAAIKALNDTGEHRVASYDLAKAQCWLDVSFHEHTRNDRSNFPSWAYEKSRLITSQLAQGMSPSPAAAVGRNDELDPAKLRGDLWDSAAALKTHKGASCAAQRLACGEVALAHASHEQSQFGWRHAKPYVQMAEDSLGDAKRLADRCVIPAPARVAAPAPAPAAAPAPRVAAAPPPPPAPAPIAAPAPAPRVTTETLNLGAKVQFAFDKGGLNDMLPGSQAELKELADRLARVYSRIDGLVVTGHTDRLGSAAYNAKLAKTRADTVRVYLASAGVQAPIDTRFEGSAKPLSSTCTGKPQSAELKACLQQDRRVEVQVTGVKR